MWQRWNGTTKIFEKSSDNGVVWTPLGLDAAILTQGKINLPVPRSNGADADAIILADTVTGAQTPGFGTKILGYSNAGGQRSGIAFEAGASGTNNESQVSILVQNSAATFIKGLTITSTGELRERGRSVPLGTWQAYTVSWVTSGAVPALGNGSLAGHFTVIGKTVFFRIHLSVGSTTNIGTGYFIFGLPPTPYLLSGFVISGSAAIVEGGSGKPFMAIPVSGSYFFGNANTVSFIAYQTTAADVKIIGQNIPMGWVTGSSIFASGFYEIQ